ncbi:MAG: hypothetical protein RL538_107 [Candidatus Parcubacteria bacterium]|jgi:hypothetical protein
MAKRQKYKNLLDKSLAAAVSAIEIYNKPDFHYREETFAILMVNAWELLLKAKVLKDNKNVLKSIYKPGKTRTKDNKVLKRFFPATNRSGNPQTIDIYTALDKTNPDKILRENIELLVEIRDNAVHFTNDDKSFSKKVLEIGTATLRSYVAINRDWFEEDLSRYNFYLMPLSFFHPFEFESHSLNKIPIQIKNILSFIKRKEKKYPSDESKTHNIGLALETKFVKSNSTSAMSVRYTDDPKAVPVKVEEDNVFQTKYPLSFKKLQETCKERYIDFKPNPKFHAIKRTLESIGGYKYARPRYLDLDTKKNKKMYYSPEIFKELDKYYQKKT